ncbi:MAG TPA: signal peptidase II [Acidimicrobiia bacterium]|nr:signal peptidase II [Acidimicrobiia bacterium]
MENAGADRAAGDADTPPGPRPLLRVGAVVAALVVVDQITKSWAVAALADGPVSVIGDAVELRLVRNPGGAFGRFQGLTPLLALGAIAITVFLVRTVRTTTDRILLAGLTLILAGALGNLGDRVFRSPGVLRGHVVDFVSVGWWPVFNVADSCISIGAVLLIVHGFRAPAETPTTRHPSP